MGLRVEKLRLVLEMQAKDLTRGVTKSIVNLKKLDVETKKASVAVDKSLDRVGKAAAEAGEAQSKAWEKSIVAAKKFAEGLKKAARDVELSVFKIRTSTAKAVAGVPNVFNKLDTRLGQSVQSIKRSVNSARVAIGILGGAAILAAPIKFAASFEKALANVDTLLVDASVSIEQYEKQLLKLSVTTSKELIDLTQGLYQTISAGIPAVEGAGGAFEVLEKATKAAEAGLATTEQAVDAFTTILNAYSEAGLTASEVSDKLFTTVRIGKTTFPELASSIGRVATVASKFNIDIDEMLAAIAELTKNGLSSDEAVTQLRATILGLARPADKVRQRLSEMGVEIGAAAFESKGLIGVLKDVGAATGGNADEIAKLLPNVRALVGGLVLGSEGAAGFEKSIGSLRESTGATNAAFVKIEKTFAQTFAIFKSQVQSTLVVVGSRILPQVQAAFERFGEAIVENQKEIVEGFKAFADALFAIGKFIVKFGPSIIKFMVAFFAVSRITKATKALAGFGAEMSVVLKNVGAGDAAGKTFLKGFGGGLKTLPKILGSLLRSPTLIGIVVGAGILLGDALIDGMTEAVTRGERQLQAILKENLRVGKLIADLRAQQLGFGDVEEQRATAQQRQQGGLIEIGENAPQGEAVGRESLLTVDAAFQDILRDTEGNLESARRILSEEIEEEVELLKRAVERSQASARRQLGGIQNLLSARADIKDFSTESAKELVTELDGANALLLETEAKTKEIKANIERLRRAGEAVGTAEFESRAEAAAQKKRVAAQKAAVAKTKQDEEDAEAARKRREAAFKQRLRASEQARRALLKGATDLRLKDAASAAAFEQQLAERVLKEQASAAAESVAIAKARGDSDAELLELETQNAESRIELINAVEEAQSDAFTASLALQKQTDDARVSAIEELGKKALLSARGAADKVLEIETAVQAKIGSVLDKSAIKRQQIATRRVAQAKATADAVLAVETSLAAARRGGGPGAQGPRLTTGGVADAAESLLGNIDTFLAGELNKAQRDSASEAAQAAADAAGKAASASARFRTSGADVDKRAALSAIGSSEAARAAATEAATKALGGAGLLAGASGVIGIALAVDKAVDLIGTIGVFLETGLTDFGSKIGANFEQLGVGLEAFPNQIIELVETQIPEFIDRFFERLPEVLKALIPGLITAVGAVIKSSISSIPEILTGIASVFLDPGFWKDIIVSSALAYFESVKSFFSNEFLAKFGSLLVELLTGALADAVEEIVDRVLPGDQSGESRLPQGLQAIPGLTTVEGVLATGAKGVGLLGKGLSAINPFHSGGSIDRSIKSPNAAAFMSAAGAPGFQGGGLVESVGAGLRNAFGAAFKDDVPATLQTGEFVLSRQAVAALGGPRGAEAVNRGGSPGGASMVTITPSPGGMDALLRTLIASVTVEAATPGTGLRNAVVGADPFLGSQFVRGRKA